MAKKVKSETDVKVETAEINDTIAETDFDTGVIPQTMIDECANGKGDDVNE